MKHIISILVLGTFLSQLLIASPEKTLVNIDGSGIALQKYDPVAYFTDHKPVPGRPEFTASYQGATYYFASVQHQALFAKEPARYAPQFGGFCAYGVSRGKTVPVDVSAFELLNGKLFLQYDTDTLASFNKNPQENLQKAQNNWPHLVEKKGK